MYYPMLQQEKKKTKEGEKEYKRETTKCSTCIKKENERNKLFSNICFENIFVKDNKNNKNND